MPSVGPIRLTKEDHEKLMEFVKVDGRTQADVLREAVITYVHGYNTAQQDARLKERDELIVNALKQIENRFALLLVRLGIDIEALYALGWSLTAEQPDQEEMFQKCTQVAYTRFHRKTKGLERQLVDSLLHQGDQLKAPQANSGKKNKTDHESGKE